MALDDKPNNENFQNKKEKLQYKTCLVIPGATQKSLRGKNMS